jgi:hypothetical protein
MRNPFSHLINVFIAGGRFKKFARANGLIYFGPINRTDEHEPVYGFTVSTAQSDTHYVTGSIYGHDVRLVQRIVPTVTHGKTMTHTWLIATMRHTLPHVPRVLLLSHEHPRDVIEAAYLHADRATHVAIEPQLDAKFLIYAHRENLDDIKENLTPELVTLLIAHPEYDYEFGKEHIYVYHRTSGTDEHTLTTLLQTAVHITDAYQLK